MIHLSPTWHCYHVLIWNSLCWVYLHHTNRHILQAKPELTVKHLLAHCWLQRVPVSAELMKRLHLDHSHAVSSATQLCSTLCNPMDCRLQPTRLLCQWNFSGKNTGVGCHFLFPFPTRRSNLCLLCLLYWQAFFTTVPPEKPPYYTWSQANAEKWSSG